MIDLRAGGFKGSVRVGLLIAAITAATSRYTVNQTLDAIE